MEAAMAASRGGLGVCCRLEFAKNKELIFCGRGDVRGSSFHGGFACSAEKNTLQTPKLKPPGHGFLSDKKMITLLEALSKDLSVLSDPGARSNDPSLADEARGRILAGALEVVTTQSAQGKAERKQRKRELKALKKALKARKDDESSWISPSDSAEVVDVSRLCGSSQQERPTAGSDPRVDSRPIPAILMKNCPEEGLHLEFGRTANRLAAAKVVAEQQQPSGDKIEVCMGTKCKKMGSQELLEAFEGCGGGVEAVGCKCMGKCKSAPNVRVHRLHSHGHDVLHLGVAIADVDSIVSHHFGAVVPA